jgi:hypothetical protein
VRKTRRGIAIKSDDSPVPDTPLEQAIPERQEPIETPEPSLSTPTVWSEFLQTATDNEVRERFAGELSPIIGDSGSSLSGYTLLALLVPEDSISSFELDQIYSALSANGSRDRNVLLILLSRGGIIEPAYQISKLCKAYSKERFVVVVPRQAKSAATLIALGADEIHMGPLGQLGPIDPQLGGLPALGVTQALQTIASLSQQYPGSAEMFARYLRLALTVEQIGYCDRVSESAVQYAERLLSTKPTLVSKASQIARELVYEYKDHGFVIDLDEAQRHLGNDWVKTGTPELEFAEKIYRYFDWVNLFLGFHQSKRLLVMGSLNRPVVVIFEKN